MKPETKKAAHTREVAERLKAKDEVRTKMNAFVNNHPVGKAAAPLLNDAMESAEKDAREYIDYLMPQIEAAGWDLNVVAPYPNSHSSKEDYRKALAKRTIFSILTKPRAGSPSSYRRGEPQFREPCAEGVARFIENEKRDAAFNYEAFQYKLVDKIGECETATLDGNHVWSFSVLKVVKAGGVIENWKTQQIVNRSVYGLRFNQYPSRKVK